MRLVTFLCLAISIVLKADSVTPTHVTPRPYGILEPIEFTPEATSARNYISAADILILTPTIEFDPFNQYVTTARNEAISTADDFFVRRRRQDFTLSLSATPDLYIGSRVIAPPKGVAIIAGEDFAFEYQRDALADRAVAAMREMGIQRIVVVQARPIAITNTAFLDRLNRQLGGNILYGFTAHATEGLPESHLAIIRDLGQPLLDTPAAFDQLWIGTRSHLITGQQRPSPLTL